MHMNIPALMIGKFGGIELIVVLLIVLVLFGPKQLPKLSKMFGSSIKNFKDGMQEDSEEEKEVKKAETSEASDKVD